MTEPVEVAVPRKGRPLAAAFERITATAGDTAADGDRPSVAEVVDDVVSILRYEKAVAKDNQTAEGTVYDRLKRYSDLESPFRPEFTLVRDDRAGRPRRIVFDSLTVSIDGTPVRFVGREEPFRAVRTHEVPLAIDSADLVLEEVVELRSEPLHRIGDLNERIDPQETDVRVATGLGDTVYHTLLGTPSVVPSDATLDRSFLREYEGPLCVSPRYERLVNAVLGTEAAAGVEFCHPGDDREEEAAIAAAGLGVYLTETGGTAREHGLVLGEQLFPSETVLLENVVEVDDDCEVLTRTLREGTVDSELAVQ